jgi:dipeptidyl-peptidase 4
MQPVPDLRAGALRQDGRVDSYPRQRARTRGFRLGAPRIITPAPDGQRVIFTRSSAGTDPVADLWVLDLADTQDGQPFERRVVDARSLLDEPGDIPDAERARRERLREVGEGIAAYTTDRAVRTACFAIAGRVFVVDLAGTEPSARELPFPDGAVDPRISPDGTKVGCVIDRSIRVIDLATEQIVTLATDTDDTVTWGLADFIAAEEFNRIRGWWWLPDGSGVLAERVDDAPVDTWWITDPANPSASPRSHRYPAAGRPNADVSLWLLRTPDRTPETPVSPHPPTSIAWNSTEFPYLTSVHIGEDAGADPIIAVLSRDQRRTQVLRIDATTGHARTVAEHADDAWVDVIPGVPALDPLGRLIEVVRDVDSDTYRLIRDGVPVSPPGFQVTSVADIGAAGMVVHGSSDPIMEIPTLVGDDLWWPLVAEGYASARRVGDLIILARSTPASADSWPPAEVNVYRLSAPTELGEPVASVASFAEVPVVAPRVSLGRSGSSRLPTSVLFPRNHEPGSRRLPILLAPYGGPHARRVVDSRMAFATDQWWADQGFCVVIADGRGTPGRGPQWERAVSGDLAAPVLDDQIEALDAILATYPEDTDPERVGIHGWSFGGFLAALAVLRRPDRVHAAIAGAPVTQWALYDTAYTERYLGDPTEHPEAYRHSSLIDDAPDLIRPLLIVHGLADDNVVVAHTLRLSSALLAAGRTHSVLPLSGVTHMTPQEVIAENLLLTQRDFLLHHLT